MQDKYVNAELFIKQMKEKFKCKHPLVGGCISLDTPPPHFNELEKELEACASLEIVRCKDCRFGRPPKGHPNEKYLPDKCILCDGEQMREIHRSGNEPAIMYPNDFCSYGERKDTQK